MVLWPAPTKNVSTLLKIDGLKYDEEDFLSKIPASGTKKAADTTRSIRNTVEVMNLAGLSFRTGGPADTFRLTDLGRLAADFLGILTQEKVANEANVHLIGQHFVFGLSCVAEYRAIWEIMLLCGGLLSNEELNRAFAALNLLSEVKEVSSRIMVAREKGDPRLIGPRAYDDDKFEELEKRNDQRKAMNPWFLLAGAGGILISFEDRKEHRRMPLWAVTLIQTVLKQPCEMISLSSPTVCHAISKQALAPRSLTK